MKYKTCASITEKNPSKLNLILNKTLKKSDYAEIRFDFLKSMDIPIALELVKSKLSKCVCTLRPKHEGGKFSGTEKERKSIIKLIIQYNPFLMDVEYNTISKDPKFKKALKISKTKILVSWHDFNKTSSLTDLERRFKKMKKISDYVKIVTMAKSISDASRILVLYNDIKIKLIAFAMGEEAKFTRILCLHLGSPFTYVSLGKAIAPGQFSLKEIKSLQN
jgi:3-dehydroquinate dehydratase-1|tara:strand:- start:6980 stop:7639 length:660 start_codon:yes stop_codon:yes gene_type:complete